MRHCWTILCLFLLSSLSLTATHTPASFLDPIKDQILAVRGSATVFDVLPQRTASEAVLRVGLVEEPLYGSVAFFGTDSMEYRPREVDCGQTDRFIYFVETSAGRKEVEVFAEILCESLTILSGFSPDGDGINDTFTILGVENYPDNRLTIFNKWGEKIYQARGYQNDWDGTDEQGRPLYQEDGLFYYVFEDGLGKTFSGYVQVKR
ncbi:MAG: gliding motility-associated C-terminal domain-containing protein [Bacteroidetes bacterium]|nr:MAG: gliding motility-associated C-terminal domain-containing protein [Bacteroidota bacterium]